MNFSAWSIRNPVAPLLAFFLLMVLGWQSFNALPITRFPNIDVPLVAVSVAQSGAAPAEMESQVTKEIEDAVAGLTGAKRVKNYLKTLNMELTTVARACGKSNVHHLEREDLVALTIEAAAMAKIPLAGTDWIPGVSRF